MKNITITSLREKQKDSLGSADDFFKKPKNGIKELEKKPEKPLKPKKLKMISKTILFILFILTVGGVGGIIIDRFALPYFLVKYPTLNQYEFLKKVNESTTVIEVTKEIKISNDEAVVDAIKKVSPSVVEIVEFSSDDEVLSTNGSGIILTSDGYIITSIQNITPEEKGTIKVILKDEAVYEMKLVKINIATGLAIIKIEENNLPVIALSNSENLKLGETVIVIDSAVITDIVSKFIDDYSLETSAEEEPVLQKRIKIINSLKTSFDGAPVINVKGEIIGISQSGDLFIPTNEVRDFIDSMTEEDL